MTRGRGIAVGLCAGVACALATAAPAYAWDDFGHMEVAAAAYARLRPATRTRVAALLRLNPHYADWIVGAKDKDVDRVAFQRAATWADAIKADRSYQDDKPTDPTAAQNIGYGDKARHAYWHFVDHPFSPDGTPLVEPSPPNLETQVPLLAAALAAPDTSDDVRSYDLVWLEHLVGDAHQPLHCVSRFDAADKAGDRGGNSVKITGNQPPTPCDDPRYCPYGPPGDLHAFWDDIEGAGYATAGPATAARKLPRPDPTAAAVRDVAAWVQEGVALAQARVYVAPIGLGDGPFPIDAAYQAAAVQLGKERIALAGARLANLLNDALGK